MATRTVTGREIGALLRLHRLSQWDLAMKAGINQASISAGLRGREVFGPEREERLTRAIVELGLLNPVKPDESEPVFQIPVSETSE